MITETYIVDESAHNIRVDLVLSGIFSDISRTHIKALIRDGRLIVRRDDNNHRVIDPAWHVRNGDAVTLDIPTPVASTLQPEKMLLDILYEDGHVIVLNKPAGMVVHPSAGHVHGTLVHGLLAHCGDALTGIGDVKRPGIVHRLDKDTSGVMVIAKTNPAHQSLSAQFAEHGRDGKLEREYIGLVWGAPRPTQGIISTGYGRNPDNWRKMAVLPTKNSTPHAITHYHAQPSTTKAITPIICKLETGRTHQIRVHMHHLKHPIIGDALYGSNSGARVCRLSPMLIKAFTNLKRQALHAQMLSFVHPASGDKLRFTAPAPRDMAACLDILTP